MTNLRYLFEGGSIMERDITIFDVANTFLSYELMTNKKLQKLCYYAQAWYLALNKKPLVKECRFEAWIHGPVCPDLYHKYKDNGRHPISEQDINTIYITDDYDKDFIKSIYDVYGNLTGDELELLTHNEDPWKDARGNLKEWEYCRRKISEENMAAYYSKE